MVAACSDEEKYSTTNTDVLTFSVDTLKMDTVFSTIPSSTYSFWVYNRCDASLLINRVALEKGTQGFRVNVDGEYLDGELNGVEVRKGDSLCVFVELTAPKCGQTDVQPIGDCLVFNLSHGKQQKVPLRAHQWDADIHDQWDVNRNVTLDSPCPIIIRKGLHIATGSKLTLRSAQLFFHDGAGIDVEGSLQASECLFRGDRLDAMFDDLPYDRVSGQWKGIVLAPNAKGEWTDCVIRNATDALQLGSNAEATLLRTSVHNSSASGIFSEGAHLALTHCRLTNAGGCCLEAKGGSVTADHCTFAQFYPFSADRGEAFRTIKASVACTHSLMTGYDDLVFSAEGSDLHFSHCMIRSDQPLMGDTFTDIVWEATDDEKGGKSHFRLVDETIQSYDFSLLPTSPAYQLGIGDIREKTTSSEP